jgi:hypothetical protein
MTWHAATHGGGGGDVNGKVALGVGSPVRHDEG